MSRSPARTGHVANPAPQVVTRVGGFHAHVARESTDAWSRVAQCDHVMSAQVSCVPAISLVIPAYNEQARLPQFLESLHPYMQRVFGELYEVIVVDDGSADGTVMAVASLQQNWPQLALKRHNVNLGKGAAVRTGIQSSRGDVVLFADADGACALPEEEKLRNALSEGADIAVGSRRVGRSLERSRRWYRAVIGWCFAKFTRTVTGLGLEDTQCGFKMFRGPVARELFEICPRDDYLFDVHVLISAQLQGFRIAEVGVNWCEIAGSHVHLLRDSLKMMAGLLAIRYQVMRAVSRRGDRPRP